MLSTGNRTRQGSTVDKLQLTTHRNTTCQPTAAYLMVIGQIGDVIGGDIAFHGSTGGENELLDLTLPQQTLQAIQA